MHKWWPSVCDDRKAITQGLSPSSIIHWKYIWSILSNRLKVKVIKGLIGSFDHYLPNLLIAHGDRGSISLNYTNTIVNCFEIACPILSNSVKVINAGFVEMNSKRRLNWLNTSIQNTRNMLDKGVSQLVDFKTAMYIKSSLKVYEKSRDKFQKSYFKF